jgi:hypothetical protein
VYGLGILGALVLFGSAFVSAILVLVSDATVHISGRGLALSVVLVGAAVVLKATRWRRGRR